MKARSTLLRRMLKDEGGGVALEFAIVGAVFIISAFGIIEFGRTLQIRNEMSYALDHGARLVLLCKRDHNNEDCINSESRKEAVTEAIRANFNGYDPERLVVTLAEETVDGVDFRSVSMAYPMDIFIPGFTGTVNLTMSRRVPHV